MKVCLAWVFAAALVLQSLVSPVICGRSLLGYADQKAYYPPQSPHSGANSSSRGHSSGCRPPSSGGSSSGSHGSSPSHDGSYGTTPSHGGSYSSPPSHGRGSGCTTRPVTPTPSVPTPVTPTPRVPTPLTPSHGGSNSSPPSHGRGSGSTTRPVTPTPSVPTPVTPTPRVPTPLTPSHGGSHSSPPSHGRGSGSTTRPVTPTPSVPTPVTPTPRVPTPLTPTPILTPPSIPNFPPITGTCDFWRTNPSLVWGILGFWRNIGHMFGMPATNVFGGNPTVRNALENTRTDGYGALLREGTASFLNSMASHSFPFTTQRVKESFTASLVSEKAAAAQAKRFRKANEGHYKN